MEMNYSKIAATLVWAALPMLALTSPIMTADWEADSDHRWTVPIGGGFGRLFKIGSQPVTAQISAYKNVITLDDYGPDWQVRAMITWMFPR